MDGSMFIGTWWSLVPPLLAIVLALVTKEVYSSLFIGVAMGALLYTGFHPWNAFVAFFDIMKNSMNLNILIFDVLLGMIIVLMSKSGGSAAYGKWAGTKIKSKKSAMLATTGLGVLIFVDDYFNCLTVGSVMRPVTDRFKVSRAKLAYIIDATAAPVCIIAPISSWAAAVNSYVPAGSSMSGFEMFVKTIPFNLYAILTLYMVFFTSIVGFDFGLMKKHEENAAKGDLFTSGGEEFQNQETKDPTEGGKYAKGKVIDLIAPMVVMIATAIAAMIWTGHLNGGQNLVEDFANCSSSEALVFAGLVTVGFLLLLYLPRRVIGFKDFMNSVPEGGKLMMPAILILVLAWTLKGMTDALGIGTFVRSAINLNSSLMNFVPLVIFCIYVVVGYLKEQFVTLEEEYPGVKLIENPYYDTCNNISSLYVAREYIENAFILDGDQIIYNPEILAPEFERSGYNSVWTDDETDEWLQTVENGIVTACSRTGGKGGWQLYSISRWTAEDGKKLKRHLEIEFEQKKNRQIYWDDVAMFCYPEEYQLGIRPMNKDDIIEVDNLSELIALDASYKKYVEEK